MDTKEYKTEQESFWAGSFGSDYIKRNQGDELLASNLNFFSKALYAQRETKTCIEFGANIGMNLKALKLLHPTWQFDGIEINTDAAVELGKVMPASNVHNTSILEFNSQQTWDVVLIKGVLIHINPDELPAVYGKLVVSSARYLLIAEYYNPSQVAIPYRGHTDRLFKRDFAGEIIERHPYLKLLDYGFVYRGDPNFPQDDITWFLLEKK